MMWVIGYYGVYLGDVDGFDMIYCVNNMFEYMLLKWYGLMLSGLYLFGGVVGSINVGLIWVIGI